MGIIMPRTTAMIRASNKYEAEKVERVLFRVPKGKKKLLQQHAAAQGELLSAFLKRAVNEALKRDKNFKNNKENA